MVEEEKLEEEEELEPAKLRYKISSYGADYPVDSLVKRLDKDIIYLPEFQRHYVWTLTQASKFIESLLLGLPVPGIFLSKEPETNKMQIIDGQQRLRTLQYFYTGLFGGKEFKLTGVIDQFDGLTYKTLSAEDRQVLDDSIIHITIIRQEEPRDDDSSIYYIFERLNTGGTLLRPQEIRACVYHGPFNKLLSGLETNQDWLAIYGKPDNRLKSQEFILRFFAFKYYRDNYEKPLKEFLNQYMSHNRNLQMQNADTLQAGFSKTCALINRAIGSKAFRPKGQLVAAILDSFMVATSTQLEKRGTVKEKDLLAAYNKLLEDIEYQEATANATSDEAVVDKRFKKALAAMERIP